jgi:hypothetical protein
MLVVALFGEWGGGGTGNVWEYDDKRRCIRSFRTTVMFVLGEIKKIVNGYDTVRVRPFMVSIRCRTADRFVSVKLRITAKYGPFTVRIQYGAYYCAH